MARAPAGCRWRYRWRPRTVARDTTPANSCLRLVVGPFAARRRRRSVAGPLVVVVVAAAAADDGRGGRGAPYDGAPVAHDGGAQRAATSLLFTVAHSHGARNHESPRDSLYELRWRRQGRGPLDEAGVVAVPSSRCRRVAIQARKVARSPPGLLRVRP